MVRVSACANSPRVTKSEHECVAKEVASPAGIHWAGRDSVKVGWGSSVYLEICSMLIFFF